MNRQCLEFACIAFTSLFMTNATLAQGQPEALIQHTRVVQPPVRLLDIEFAGGTLYEFTKAVQLAAGEHPVNVVLRGDAGSMPIPAVNLLRVTPEAAFESVCQRDRSSINIIRSDGAPIITIETLHRAGWQQSPMSPSVQQAAEHSVFRMQDDMIPSLRVYSVSDIVDGQTMTYETLLDALRLALEIDGGDPRPEVLHHESSGVLIVRGTSKHEFVTRQMLEAIRNDTHSARVTREQLEREIEKLEHAMLNASIQIQRADIEMHAAAERHHMLMQFSEEGFATDEEVLDAKLRLDRAMLDKTQAESQYIAQESRLESTKRRLESSRNTAKKPSTQLPMQDREMKLNTQRPEQVAELFTTINNLLASSGSHGTISIVEVRRTSDPAQRFTVVRFRGDPAAIRTFQELCERVLRLDQPAP